MSTESTMLPYQRLAEAIGSYFPETPEQHEAISGHLVSLCQIPGGASEITQAQYDKALLLMESVKSGEASDLRHANDIVEGNITEVQTRSASSALQRLEELSEAGAERIASELDGVDELLGGRVVQHYTHSVMEKLPAALERAKAKKQGPGSGSDGVSTSVVDLVDRVLGLPASSDEQKALPHSDP